MTAEQKAKGSARPEGGREAPVPWGGSCAARYLTPGGTCVMGVEK